MYNLKERIQKLVEKTNNPLVKEICEKTIKEFLHINNSLNNIQNYSVLENSISENLRNELLPINEKEIQDFIENEIKIEKLNRGLGVNNLINGIIESVQTFDNPIYKYKIKNLYSYLPINEWKICDEIVNLSEEFTFIPHVRMLLEAVKNNIEIYRDEIDLLRLNENFSKSSPIVYKSIKESLFNFIFDKTETNKNLLLENLNKFQFDFNCRELVNKIKAFENKNQIYFDDSSCVFVKNYSPVVYENGKEFFVINNKGYVKEELKIREMLDEEAKEFKQDFFIIADLLNSNICRVTNESVNFYLGDKEIKIMEENGDIYVNKDKFSYNHLKSNYKLMRIVTPAHFNIFENILKIYEYKRYICEIDFVTSIINNNLKDRRVDVFMLENKTYVNFYDKINKIDKFVNNANATQIRNSVLEHIGYDISKSFYQFLNEEEKAINILKDKLNSISKNISFIEEKIDYITKNSDINNPKIKDLLRILDEDLTDKKDKYFSIKLKLEEKTKLDITKENEEIIGVNDIVEYDGDEHLVLSCNSDSSCVIRCINSGIIKKIKISDLKIVKKCDFKHNQSYNIDNQNSMNSVSYKIY